MSITLRQGHVIQLGLKQKESIYCGLSFNRFAGFLDSISLMHEGDPKNHEHWVQKFTTIPEISSTDHRRHQTTDKRIYVASRPILLKNM